MKFLFNLSTQTLKIPHGENTYSVFSEATFTTPYGGLGFRLDDYNHWINFTITKTKIVCFYKVPQGDSALYYRKEINRPSNGIIEVEFSERDRIEKVNGVWRAKSP